MLLSSRSLWYLQIVVIVATWALHGQVAQLARTARRDTDYLGLLDKSQKIEVNIKIQDPDFTDLLQSAFMHGTQDVCKRILHSLNFVRKHFGRQSQCKPFCTRKSPGSPGAVPQFGLESCKNNSAAADLQVLSKVTFFSAVVVFRGHAHARDVLLE